MRKGSRKSRKFQNKKSHGLNRLPNIITTITSRRMRLAGHLLKMEKVAALSEK